MSGDIIDSWHKWKPTLRVFYIGIIKGNVLSLHLLQACLQLFFWFFYRLSKKKLMSLNLVWRQFTCKNPDEYMRTCQRPRPHTLKWMPERFISPLKKMALVCSCRSGVGGLWTSLPWIQTTNHDFDVRTNSF